MASSPDIDALLEQGLAGRVEQGDDVYFLKRGNAAALHAEAHGLERLAAANAVRVPHCFGVHERGAQHVLVVEWLDLRPMTATAAHSLGLQLAMQHQVTAKDHGLDEDNFIGLGVQLNRKSESWCEFFRDNRLMPLLHDLKATPCFEPGLRLAAALEDLLRDHEPAASLLHGDLWAGNAAMLPDETPVIFDPAVHYGDRECDLAMTKLFGGFPRDFHAAYEGALPLPPGWQQREKLYQLYHVMNHARLFGGGYTAQAERLIRQLLE